MKIKKSFLITGIAILVLVFAGVKITGFATNVPGKYDDFAQCLTDSGTKMYGAYWCPHCKEQKKMFGKSWDYIDYIECSTPDGRGQTEECTQAGITGYPTWGFSDGSRLSGKLPMKTLSTKSGCELN